MNRLCWDASATRCRCCVLDGYQLASLEGAKALIAAVTFICRVQFTS